MTRVVALNDGLADSSTPLPAYLLPVDLLTFENILVSKYFQAPADTVSMTPSRQAAVTFIPIGRMNVCQLFMKKAGEKGRPLLYVMVTNWAWYSRWIKRKM